jgi:hypothetical protein
VTSGPARRTPLRAVRRGARAGRRSCCWPVTCRSGPGRTGAMGAAWSAAAAESADQGALFEPLAKAVPAAAGWPGGGRRGGDGDRPGAVAAVRACVLGIPADVPRRRRAVAPTPSARLVPDPRRAGARAGGTAAGPAPPGPVIWVGGGRSCRGGGCGRARARGTRGRPPPSRRGAPAACWPARPPSVDAPPHEPEVADLVAAGATCSSASGPPSTRWRPAAGRCPGRTGLLVIGCDPDDAVRGWGADAVDQVLVADAAVGAAALVHRVVPNERWCDPDGHRRAGPGPSRRDPATVRPPGSSYRRGGPGRTTPTWWSTWPSRATGWAATPA